MRKYGVGRRFSSAKSSVRLSSVVSPIRKRRMICYKLLREGNGASEVEHDVKREVQSRVKWQGACRLVEERQCLAQAIDCSCCQG